MRSHLIRTVRTVLVDERRSEGARVSSTELVNVTDDDRPSDAELAAVDGATVAVPERDEILEPVVTWCSASFAPVTQSAPPRTEWSARIVASPSSPCGPT
jgi:hypothetical protein